MSRLPSAPYSQYRPSGVEWLTELPRHWTNSTLGFECSVKARLGWKGLKAEEYVESGYIFLATPNIKGQTIDFDDVNYITQERYEESPEIMLEIGDVLVTKDGSTTGTTNLVRHLPAPATVNSSIAVLRSFGRLDSQYLYQFFNSDYTQNVITRMRDGMGVPHLFQADLRKFFVPVPPLEEQTQIAKFLDYETAKIDALIEKQQQLIALLKEKRQAVISRAVTKGLNPDAPMRDSGVEWLGEIPAHWMVTKVRHRYEVQLGKMLDQSRISGDNLFPYLRVYDVQWGEINIVDLPQMDFDRREREKFRLQRGDLLVNEGGSYVGRSALWKGELDDCFYQKALHRMRPIGNEDTAQFLYYVMRVATEMGVFVAGGNQTTIDHLTAAQLNAYRFPFPPLIEQQRIVKFLDERGSKFDGLISLAEQTVVVLQERRTALISAAVTGKIDVRDWKAPESATEVEVA